jgi:hypothetical protein
LTDKAAIPAACMDAFTVMCSRTKKVITQRCKENTVRDIMIPRYDISRMQIVSKTPSDMKFVTDFVKSLDTSPELAVLDSMPTKKAIIKIQITRRTDRHAVCSFIKRRPGLRLSVASFDRITSTIRDVQLQTDKTLAR